MLGKALSAASGAHCVCVSTAENSLQTPLSTLKMLFFLRESPAVPRSRLTQGSGERCTRGTAPLTAALPQLCLSLLSLPDNFASLDKNPREG